MHSPDIRHSVETLLDAMQKDENGGFLLRATLDLVPDLKGAHASGFIQRAMKRTKRPEISPIHLFHHRKAFGNSRRLFGSLPIPRNPDRLFSFPPCAEQSLSYKDVGGFSRSSPPRSHRDRAAAFLQCGSSDSSLFPAGIHSLWGPIFGTVHLLRRH